VPWPVVCEDEGVWGAWGCRRRRSRVGSAFAAQRGAAARLRTPSANRSCEYTYPPSQRAYMPVQTSSFPGRTMTRRGSYACILVYPRACACKDAFPGAESQREDSPRQKVRRGARAVSTRRQGTQRARAGAKDGRRVGSLLSCGGEKTCGNLPYARGARDMVVRQHSRAGGQGRRWAG
jgi:hypothetical protein